MRIPTATYRCQFTPRFGFRNAEQIIPYLADLGVSDVYAAPIFRARHGSEHGYDIVDPNALNEELGSSEDFEHLRAQVALRGMGWIQDIVPNHMAFTGENRLLMDVVEHGEQSVFHSFFDIEWDHPYESLKGRLLAPFLGKFYAQALAEGEISLCYGEEGLYIKYYDFQFPLSLRSYRQVFMHDIGQLEKKLGSGNGQFLSFLGTIELLKPPPPADTGLARFDQIVHAKRMLWKMYQSDLPIKEYVDASVAFYNGRQSGNDGYGDLDTLLSRQFFRLSFWKVASEELNYRRFFAINNLISLRVERDDVFLHTHDLVLRSAETGIFTGLRVDHIDGLYHPAAYLEKLRARLPETFIIVEKILATGEQLPLWPIQGTTGYDFLNMLNGIFCRTENAGAFSAAYAGFIGHGMDPAQSAYESKRTIILHHMAGDIDNLAQIMKRGASKHRYGRDITLYGLRAGLVEMLALFPVYRTYINKWEIGEQDASVISHAARAARARAPDLRYELDFIENFLLLRFDEPLAENEKELLLHFVMRFQQYSGPLMAKGFEDTTLYIYNRLISLNEVGGNPARFGATPGEFHEFMAARMRDTPHSLSATATHDTKRGEDARARINVLSEIPEEWSRRIAQWSTLNRNKKKQTDTVLAPDENDEYLLYQTILGSLPFGEAERPAFIDRLKAYTIKAVREAKVHTEWIKPDLDYEQACEAFVEALLTPKDNEFLRAFLPFWRKISFYGIINSLSQTLIKIAAPGIPDFYQGTELWDLSMVDPDNRRPVDFEQRQALLADIKERCRRNPRTIIPALMDTPEDGRIKLFLIQRALQARQDNARLFEKGEYLPLTGRGTYAQNLFVFARRHEKSWTIALAPRFSAGLVTERQFPLGQTIWKDTNVPLPSECPSAWRDALTGSEVDTSGTLSVGKALSLFPVALLMG
jgi:(1->4)-alpha-D-glucan 1-alpha-D-glucosylmutase